MNNKSANVFIRSLYSQGYSSLVMSFFKTKLTLCLTPYLGEDNRGLSQYCKKTFLSTTINHEGASFFYLTAMSILNGKDSENQVEAVLSCSNNTSIILEYKPDQSNQMSAYLVISKNNQSIPFRFSIHQYRVSENGRVVTKVIQTGLGVFAGVLEGYLAGIGADGHLAKLQDEHNSKQATFHHGLVSK